MNTQNTTALDYRSLERRCRRLAVRLCLLVKKSRSRYWYPNDQQGYMIIDAFHNICLAGEHFDLDLEKVMSFLKNHEEKVREFKNEHHN